jgi:ABC-type transport system involved in multi-copper enzyme maturation permease subunit
VFKESVRDKVLYNLVLFAVLMISASFLIGQLTAGQDIKIIKDLGLAASSIFGLFIAVFIGVGLVWKEVDRRSVYALLVKPIRRDAFIVGKFLGLALTLAVNLFIMMLALYAVLAFMAWSQPALARAASVDAPAIDINLVKVYVLIFVHLLLVTAIALFFSTFSSPMLSAAFTFGLYVVGHFNDDLAHFENVLKSRAAAAVARALYYALPNLAPFDIKAAVVHGQPVAWGYVALTAGYGLCYAAAVVLVATRVFSRRDFR